MIKFIFNGKKIAVSVFQVRCNYEAHCVHYFHAGAGGIGYKWV